MNVSRWKMVSYMAILMIICVLTFLVAKYTIRSNIQGEEIPIDTSTRI